ncbi:MAG: hypothetical protein ACIAQ0_14495 [Phycisphaerales bacterium JB058]
MQNFGITPVQIMSTALPGFAVLAGVVPIMNQQFIDKLLRPVDSVVYGSLVIVAASLMLGEILRKLLHPVTSALVYWITKFQADRHFKQHPAPYGMPEEELEEHYSIVAQYVLSDIPLVKAILASYFGDRYLPKSDERLVDRQGLVDCAQRISSSDVLVTAPGEAKMGFLAGSSSACFVLALIYLGYQLVSGQMPLGVNAWILSSMLIVGGIVLTISFISTLFGEQDVLASCAYINLYDTSETFRNYVSDWVEQSETAESSEKE